MKLLSSKHLLIIISLFPAMFLGSRYATARDKKCEEVIEQLEGFECVLSPALLSDADESLFLVKSNYHDELMSLTVYSRNKHSAQQVRLFFKMKNRLYLPNIKQVVITDYFIMTLTDHVTLRHMTPNLSNFKKVPTLNQKLVLFLKILKGVNALHDIGYIHGDLRPYNILLTTDKTPSISGLSHLAHIGESQIPDGNINYLSPESLLAKRFKVLIPNKPSQDVYALGIVLFQMLNLHLPYQITKTSEQFDLNQMKIEFKKGQPLETIILLRHMLDLEYDRLEIDDLIKLIENFLLIPSHNLNKETMVFKVMGAQSLNTIHFSHFVKDDPNHFTNNNVPKIIFICMFGVIIILIGLFIYCIIKNKHKEYRRRSTDMSIYFDQKYFSDYGSTEPEQELVL